jgi:hypothetical protein
MGKSRAPEIDEDGLARFSKRNDRELLALRNRFLQYEDLRQANEIPCSYIALEALASLLGGRQEGYSDADLQCYWPEAWGTATVAVPASLLDVIAQAWIEYKKGEKGRTFGEVLGIEGGGKGFKRAVSAQRKRDEHRLYGREVALLYTGSPDKSCRPTLQQAIEAVAQDHGVSFETVEAGYKKFGRPTIDEAGRNGILKGGKTS